MTDIRVIFFDRFGVLEPSRVASAVAELGGDFDRDKALISQIIRKAHCGAIPSARRALASMLGTSVARWDAACRKEPRLNAELMTYSGQLRRAGYRVGVLTNSSLDAGANEFEGHFEPVIVSAVVGLVKPEEQIFRLAAREAGVRTPQCVLVDDGRANCEAARRVGMQAVWYRGMDHLVAAFVALGLPSLQAFACTG